MKNNLENWQIKRLNQYYEDLGKSKNGRDRTIKRKVARVIMIRTLKNLND